MDTYIISKLIVKERVTLTSLYIQLLEAPIPIGDGGLYAYLSQRIQGTSAP